MSTQVRKHGPWFVAAGVLTGNPRLLVVNGEGLSVCAMSLRGACGDLKKMESRANLVAAAPGLLQAAQHAADSLRSAGIEPNADSDNPLDQLLSEIDSAIAEATGGAT